MTIHPQFLTDAKGRKTAVLLPYAEYEELLKKNNDKLEVAKTPGDWFDQLTKIQQKSVLKGLNDIQENNTSTHKDISLKVKQLLKKA